MPVISIFSGSFCGKQPLIREVLSRTGYTLVSDKEITAEAKKLSGMVENKIERAFLAKTSAFNKFTHEKERSIAYLRLALAQTLSRNNLLISGYSALLIPAEIGSVLRICLIADMAFRISVAMKKQELSPKAATRRIHEQDKDRASWVDYLFDVQDPWAPSLYDIVIPMDKTSVEDATYLIEENLAKDATKSTETSMSALEDFFLSAHVEVLLAEEGHNVKVTAKNGRVFLTINQQVLALGRLEKELKLIASKAQGVGSVETRVGKNFYQADIYRKFDLEMPSKILLVDDERKFATTLSERLLMRDMGSVVAYDGESALKLLNRDDPEVMILDLRMPGIDGIAVLKRVKASRPGIEVIILTGHGSEEDEKICMALGAFAYLQKPVDIDVLSDTLKRANEKIQARKK